MMSVSLIVGAEVVSVKDPIDEVCSQSGRTLALASRNAVDFDAPLDDFSFFHCGIELHCLCTFFRHYSM